MWPEDFVPAKFARERERQGLTPMQIEQRAQDLLKKQEGGLQVKSGGMVVRTISNIENGAQNVGYGYVELYARILDKPLDFFRRVRPDPKWVAELVRLCLVAVFRGFLAAWSALLRPWEISPPFTSPGKINPADPTKPVDQSTSDAMWAVFREFASKVTHFLSGGVILVDEEKGVRLYPEGTRSPRFIVQIDSSDDTTALERFLGGTILISVYQFGVGIVAAAACDFVRGLIFSRGITGNTQAIKLAPGHTAGRPSPETDFIEPTGSTVPLALSERQALEGATLNSYLGRFYRVGLLAALAPGLAAREDVNLVSYGGSRGPLLVAEGLIDASLELTKGFKLLDSIPGLFLAKGAGACVLNLDTNAQFNFGPDGKLEEIFTLPEEQWAPALDKYRVRFLVAATENLARAIQAGLPVSATAVSRGSSK